MNRHWPIYEGCRESEEVEAEMIPTRYSHADVPYTANEQRIYKFIATQPGRMARSTDVIKVIYPDGPPPRNARIIVGGMLATLKRKLDQNQTRLALKRSARRGPYPIDWQLVRRPARRVARRARGEARAAA
jgi:hypothetical protein